MMKRKKEHNQNAEFAGQSNLNAQNIRNNVTPEKFYKIRKKTNKKKPTLKWNEAQDENSKPNGLSTRSDSDMNRLDDDNSKKILKCDNRTGPIIGQSTVNQRNKRKQLNPKKNAYSPQHLSAVDLGEWIPRQLCCGKVYENNEIDAVLINMPQYSPENCPIHGNAPSTSSQASTSAASSAFISMEPENKDEVSSGIKLPRNKQYLKQSAINATPVQNKILIVLSKPSTSNDVSSHVNQAQVKRKFRDNSGKVTKRSRKSFLTALKIT